MQSLLAFAMPVQLKSDEVLFAKQRPSVPEKEEEVAAAGAAVAARLGAHRQQAQHAQTGHPRHQAAAGTRAASDETFARRRPARPTSFGPI